MANQNINNNEIELIIPKETQSKYPELVEDIKGSKSMDNKERNYWLQVLPVMTEEQVNELRDILSTEKQKLAEIEKKYASRGNSTKEASKKPEKTEEELRQEEARRQKERLELQKKEELARKEENVDNILSLLDDL